MKNCFGFVFLLCVGNVFGMDSSALAEELSKESKELIQQFDSFIFNNRLTFPTVTVNTDEWSNFLNKIWSCCKEVRLGNVTVSSSEKSIPILLKHLLSLVEDSSNFELESTATRTNLLEAAYRKMMVNQQVEVKKYLSTIYPQFKDFFEATDFGDPAITVSAFKAIQINETRYQRYFTTIETQLKKNILTFLPPYIHSEMRSYFDYCILPFSAIDLQKSIANFSFLRAFDLKNTWVNQVKIWYASNANGSIGKELKHAQNIGNRALIAFFAKKVFAITREYKNEPFNLYYFGTDLCKEFPIEETDPIFTIKHLNSAFSESNMSRGNSLFHFRKEELFKIIVHEMYHNLGLKVQLTQEVQEWFKNSFAISRIDNEQIDLNESLVEAAAPENAVLITTKGSRENDNIALIALDIFDVLDEKPHLLTILRAVAFLLQGA